MASKVVTDTNYQQWLAELKEKIRNSQVKAALKVNTELLSLYWEMGKELTEKQVQARWGDKIIAQLAKDLLSEFPGVKGFSGTNLKYIRKWYQFYASIGQQPVDQLENKLSKQSKKISQQPVGQTEQPFGAVFPAILGKVPWGHHIQIISKANNTGEALFYMQQTVVNNWSRKILVYQIESGLYQRKGKAITNFENTLPKAQSDLARETLKNPYLFDFLGLTDEIQERELEKALIQHIKKFMLELGRGFAYVGNQYNLMVEEDDFFLDLLFFNFHLNCFVVFELKVGEFKPEFAGKLNFYINTINEQIKLAAHKPTIGVLLCKTRNKTVIEYSLKGIDTPIGVADYEFTKALPKQLRAEMPTIKELEDQLETKIELLQKPIDEKKNKLKNILERIKGDEVKTEKDKESLLYIFDEVLWRIKEYTEQLLKDEMGLFKKARIDRSINNSPSFSTSVDLEAKLMEEGVNSLGLFISMEIFKKGGTKAFNIYKNLSLQLSKHKYAIVEHGNKTWGEYLYHYKWPEEELQQIAERWSELIMDDINTAAEKV